MTLHQAVADTLAERRRDIVADITNTEAAIQHVEAELARSRAAHASLLEEMRAIDDAVELLTNISG